MFQDFRLLANFLAFAYRVFTMSAHDLAEAAQQGSTSPSAIVWAYIFKAYFLSSICFWSTVLFKFVKYPASLPSTYTSVGSSSALLHTGENPV
jgi:hypothetical protein